MIKVKINCKYNNSNNLLDKINNNNRLHCLEKIILLCKISNNNHNNSNNNKVMHNYKIHRIKINQSNLI